jgi:hypothetical protein
MSSKQIYKFIFTNCRKHGEARLSPKVESVFGGQPPSPRISGFAASESDVPGTPPPGCVLQEEDDEDNTFENPLFMKLLYYLMEKSKASQNAVRYHCCNILGKLLNEPTSEQLIDDDLYNNLCQILLERLKDVNLQVQLKAIAAICRLQQPKDDKCRVIKALQNLLKCDLNREVRYQALSQIAFCKKTLTGIIDLVRDSDPHESAAHFL